MSRVRFYPYKVTYIDLQDYMAVPNGQPLSVFTDIIRAKNAQDAKSIVRASNPPTVAFITAGRYPERLGTTQGVQVTTLSKRQLKAIEDEVHGGKAKLPHPINPKAFVASKPHSTTRTATAPKPSTPLVGAPRTIVKSTPLVLATDSPLNIGGFSVGFHKFDETSVANTALSTAQVTGESTIPAPSATFTGTIEASTSVSARPSGCGFSLKAYEPPVGGFYKCSNGVTYPKAAAKELIEAIDTTVVPSLASAETPPPQPKKRSTPIYTIVYLGLAIGLMTAGVLIKSCR